MSHHSDLNTFAGTGERMLNAVKRNPEGLLLLAAGCALLLRSRSTAQRSPATGYVRKDDWQRTYDNGPASRHSSSDRSIQKSVSEAAEQAKEFATDTADRVTESVRSYASTASDYAQEAQRQASESVQEVQRQASDYAQKFAGEAQATFRNTVDYVLREQPLAVAVAGLAAGAAVAAAFPATKLEQATIGEIGSKVTEAAQDAGGQIRDTAAKAGERLKEGLDDPSKLKDTVSDIVDDVSRSFGKETDRTSEEGTSGSSRPRPQTEAAASDRWASGASMASNGATSSGSPAGGSPAAPKSNPFDRR